MDENKTYCCSLYGDKETYLNKMFNSFNEAQAEGQRILREFNENIDNPDYAPDPVSYTHLTLPTNREV